MKATDEKGNTIEIDPMSSAGQLVALLEYGRARGFRFGPTIKIDGLMVQVADLRLDTGGPQTPMPGPWEAAGFPEGDE